MFYFQAHPRVKCRRHHIWERARGRGEFREIGLGGAKGAARCAFSWPLLVRPSCAYLMTNNICIE